MLSGLVEQTVHTLDITKEERITGPSTRLRDDPRTDGTSQPACRRVAARDDLEAWPGGRWFRDLGDNTGHLWGHVQAIKPPTLPEIG
ncbi:MAG TPA: hypothetical protein VHU82_04550 [Vicinamibacterales bacterium]|jgi:hypothetical protein|nr:hypothetical protein [Vicinamibacterales bacterium]